MRFIFLIVLTMTACSRQETARPDPAPIKLMSGIDAGDGTSIYPILISRALTTTGNYYIEITNVTVDGDDISSDAVNSWLATFFLGGAGATLYPFTPGIQLWGTSSILFDASTGKPAINTYAHAGNTCTNMISAAAAGIDQRVNSHTTLLIYECGLNDALAGATPAAVCTSIQTYGQARIAAGWTHTYVNGMTDSPSLAVNFASTVNSCIRSNWKSWGLAGFGDVGPGGPDPYLSMYAGTCINGTPFCRSFYFGGDGGDGTLLTMPNGAWRYAFDTYTAVLDGGY